jgi:outer membrane receptor protein involved in Fe transport
MRFFGLACSLLIARTLFAAEPSPTELIDRPLEELSGMGLSAPSKSVEVSTANRYSQKASHAPTSVRVVTAEDIKTFGFQTLAEVLNSLPGLQVFYDRNYAYVGVRGFGRPGDYDSRVLLLVDGERMNGDVYDDALIDTSFMLDTDLIDRVEFMPGPGSALYGNNAFFGVVNVFTKRGKDYQGAEFAGQYGSYDMYRARGTLGQRFDNGAEMLLSATGSDRDGPRSLYFPEFDTPAQNQGKATGRDYDRFHNAFGKLSWSSFVLEGGYLERDKGVPTGVFQSVFNVGNKTVDTQSFVMLSFAERYREDWDVSARFAYHRTEYEGDFWYGEPSAMFLNKDFGLGEWVRGEFKVLNSTFEQHRFMFGGVVQDNLKQNLKNYNVGGPVLSTPYQSTQYGFYLQDEFQALDPLTLVVGVRYDYNPLGGSSINPRAAAIWRVLDATTLKLNYGTAFRAPNVFEAFLTSPASEPNPNLKQQFSF